MSAESGLRTFRDSGGLWEGQRVEEVATPEAWARDPERVLEFYNQRRRQLYAVEPNAGHRALASLETRCEVAIVTQNIDNLHERAGSSRVIHLHGELDMARSVIDERLLYRLEGRDIRMGDRCERGGQLRPHVVWFGEMVPEFERAAALVSSAEILIVVGTSLQVYPAATLAFLAPAGARKILVNPDIPDACRGHDFELIEATAAKGLPDLISRPDFPH